MFIPFKIYIRAVGLYALVTLPALIAPIIYFISIGYVLLYGWFAWALYTAIYLLVAKLRLRYELRFFLLMLAVIPSVLFAFQMLEVLHVEENIWHSGSFLLFPTAAVVAGWISVSVSKKEIWKTSPEYSQQLINELTLEKPE